MDARLRRLSMAAIACVLTGLLWAGGRVSYVLFEGTFDAGYTLNPEVGKFFAWTSNANSVSLLPDGQGGQLLVIDDSAQPMSSATLIAGGFINYKKVAGGNFLWKFDMTFSVPDLPFSAGIVVDNPTSDFIPASGPDGQGYLEIAGKKSNFQVPVGVAIESSILLTRANPDLDWTYEMNFADREDAGGTPQSFAGTFPGTAGRNIVGFAFEKRNGEQGKVTIDNVVATTDQPTSNSK